MKVITNSPYSIRMSVFFAAIFLPFGIYVPFFGPWLKELGMSAEEIAILLAIPMITRVVATPFMAAFADKIGDRRLTLCIYAFLFALSFALILIDDSLVWIAAILLLANIFNSAIIPISDSLAMAGVRRFNLDYGAMRLWGSAAFIGGNILGGWVIDHWTTKHIIWVLVITNCVHALLAFFLPQDPRLEDGKHLTKGTRMDWQQLRQFAQTGFWVVLAAAALLQASHSLIYSFGSIYWEEMGISSKMIGFLWAISVMAEIALFTFSPRLTARLGWKGFLVIGGIGASIRWALMTFSLPEYGYMVLQLLHCFSFAASHLGIIYFISEWVDDELSGTAQGLYTMLSGLAMGILTYFTGFAYSHWVGDAFWLMVIISIIALVLMALLPLFKLNKVTVED